jgi:hypothetical protein
VKTVREALEWALQFIRMPEWADAERWAGQYNAARTLATATPAQGREEAARRVLYALRNPLALMSVPDREEALTLAREHGLTAEDLIQAAHKRAQAT